MAFMTTQSAVVRNRLHLQTGNQARKTGILGEQYVELQQYQ